MDDNGYIYFRNEGRVCVYELKTDKVAELFGSADIKIILAHLQAGIKYFLYRGEIFSAEEILNVWRREYD
jgi:hypothetical protein